MLEEKITNKFDEYLKYRQEMARLDRLLESDKKLYKKSIEELKNNKYKIYCDNINNKYYDLMLNPELKRLDEGLREIISLIKEKTFTPTKDETLKTELLNLLINYNLLRKTNNISSREDELIKLSIYRSNIDENIISYKEAYDNILTIYSIIKNLKLQPNITKISSIDINYLNYIIEIYFKNNKALEYLCDKEPTQRKKR